MDADEETWTSSRDDFLLHVKPLSILFRAKFRDTLRETELFGLVPRGVWTHEWVVHCQPVGTGGSALKYLAPYIFRVAISNNRILSMNEGEDTVTFRYNDSATGASKTCTIAAEEFIRRFLQHILPKGFVKVRYYGLFSPGKRPLLVQVRQQLCCNDELITEEPPGQEGNRRCPLCGTLLILQETIRPRSRPPPQRQQTPLDELS